MRFTENGRGEGLAMVRELHVYGKAVEIGELKERETQHKGLGKMLMEKYIK